MKYKLFSETERGVWQIYHEYVGALRDLAHTDYFEWLGTHDITAIKVGEDTYFICDDSDWIVFRMKYGF